MLNERETKHQYKQKLILKKDNNFIKQKFV